MSLLGLGVRRIPRLVPELDDRALGGLLRQLQARPMPGLADMQVDVTERLLQETGTDWDRRWHRIGTIAGAFADTSFSESWLRRSPSADALVHSVWVEVVRAGPGARLEDPSAQIRRCMAAERLRPADPAPWVALLAVLRLERRSQRQLMAAWQEVMVRDPWHREGHLQQIGYLSGDECGSSGQLAEFLESRNAVMPWDAPARGIELVAAVRNHHRAVRGGGVNALTGDTWWRRPGNARLLEEGLWRCDSFPRPAYAAVLEDLNVLAYALVRASRLGDAAGVFRQIGPVATCEPWQFLGDPVREFAYWRGLALRRAPRRDRD